MWILYSRLINDFTVLIVNAIGVTLQVIYIIVYLLYSKLNVRFHFLINIYLKPPLLKNIVARLAKYKIGTMEPKT